MYCPVQLSWILSDHVAFLTQPPGQYFSYLTLGITPGVTTQYLSRADDGASSSIPIPGGFRFGTSSMRNVYVGIYILQASTLQKQSCVILAKHLVTKVV